jgi:hypothetical protein
LELPLKTTSEVRKSVIEQALSRTNVIEDEEHENFVVEDESRYLP